MHPLQIPTHLFFSFFLCILLALHVFWFSIILRMAFKVGCEHYRLGENFEANVSLLLRFYELYSQNFGV
jgi:hypothetical protein